MPAERTVLFLAQCLPYPPTSGVTNRTFHILEQLRKEFSVVLTPFFRVNHQPDAQTLTESYLALKRLATYVAKPSPIPAEHAIFRQAWDHLRSVVRRRPYTYYEYASRAFGRELRKTLTSWHPGLIHLDSLVDLYGWLPELPPAPVVCTHHNIESQLLRRRAAQMKPRILRAYVGHQANLVQRIEKALAPRCALNVMTSELDAKRLAALAPQATTLVVPNGVDTQYLAPSKTARVVPGRIVFLGPTYVFPNRDGVDYFLGDIWPLIRRSCSSATLELIGQTGAADRARYEAAQGVTCVGHVWDIRPHLASASCCIAPLRVGGGTRLKILDYWAMGKAVVSTSMGCEGLNTIDGENILIRDNAEAFADAVLGVLSDPCLRSRLEANGRQTAERTYGWDSVGEELRNAYRSLLA